MTGHDDRLQEGPLPVFVARLALRIGERFHKQVAIAKEELASKIQSLAVAAVTLLLSIVFGVLGLLLIVVAGVAILSLVMPIWGAVLITAAIVFLLAAILALVCKSRVASLTPILPKRMIEELKEDVRWAKTRLRS